MAKSKTPSYIVEFLLKTEMFHGHTLDKRLELGRKIYNALLTVIQKRYKEMIKTKVYRAAFSEYSDAAERLSKTSNNALIKKLKEQKAAATKQLRNLRKQYRISEYEFHADVKSMQHKFPENIDSHTAQKIATRLWGAYEKLIFGDGRELRYKQYGQLDSLEGKNNDAGIRYRDGSLHWLGLKIPVMTDIKNGYEQAAFESRIKYCRVARKLIRGKRKYYLQIVFEGMAPPKLDKETGEIKRKAGEGRVGLDIGTQTLAVSSRTDVKLLELADRVSNIEAKKRVIQRTMDRSRRAMNPGNYNADGMIKDQGSKRVIWVKSNNYLKLEARLRELLRRQKDMRRYQHNILANYIISLGDEVFVETMNYKALQKRSRETKQNDRGKFLSKKRFGKSLGNKAPSMFLDILERKLNWFGKPLNRINTWTAKASQYDHSEDTCKKKRLSQRWTIVDGNIVQRDIYSSFLIMNVTDDLQTIDKARCDATFENFIKLHNAEIVRLNSNKKLSKIAA